MGVAIQNVKSQFPARVWQEADGVAQYNPKKAGRAG